MKTNFIKRINEIKLLQKKSDQTILHLVIRRLDQRDQWMLHAIRSDESPNRKA